MKGYPKQVDIVGSVNNSSNIQLAHVGYLAGVPTELYDPITGQDIIPFAEMPWATFAALTKVNLRDGAIIRVTDVHGLMKQGGSLFCYDAVAGKFGQLTQPLYFSTFAGLPTASSFPGLIVVAGDVGGGHSPLISNGARYIPLNGRMVLFKQVYGTLASPTNTQSTGSTTWQFTIGTTTIPANLLGTNDSLFFKLRLQRHNANATMSVSANLGTAGSSADSALWINATWNQTLPLISADVYADISNSTTYLTNQTSAQTGTGSTAGIIAVNANFNTTSNMTLTINGTKNTSDTCDLISYYLEWSVS